MPTTASTNGEATSAFQAALASAGYQNNTLNDVARAHLAIANLITSPVFTGAAGFTGLITATGGISGAAASFTTGAFSGDFAVATSKFTVAAATGNTVVAGTLGVTGATTLSNNLSVVRTGAYPQYFGDAYGAGYYTLVNYRASRNSSLGSFTATLNGDNFVTFDFYGTNVGNTAFAKGASLQVIQNGTAGATYCPARFSFLTSNGTNAPTEAVSIDAVGQLSVTTTTDSVSISTGSLTTAGGLGVAKKVFIGETLSVTGTSTLTGNMGIGEASTATSLLHLKKASIPTSAAGLAAGDVWANSGVLTMV